MVFQARSEKTSINQKIEMSIITISRLNGFSSHTEVFSSINIAFYTKQYLERGSNIVGVLLCLLHLLMNNFYFGGQIKKKNPSLKMSDCFGLEDILGKS